MTVREAYTKKIEAELDLAQAKLAELKARAINSAADVRISYAKLSVELEQQYNATKAKLKEMTESSEEAWEQFKEGLESAWGELTAGVRHAAAKFQD